MYPRYNPHHVGQGLARLTDSFVRQPNIRAWLAAILTEVQALEDAAWGVFVLRALATAPVQTLPATNVVFDVIGDIVGQPRFGTSDLDYKSLIYLRIAVNRATGAVTDWSRFGAILLRAGAQAIGFYGDQSGILFSASSLPLNGSLVGSVLTQAVPNGEHGVFSYTPSPQGPTILMGSVYDPTAGKGGQGFGSVYSTTAGGGYAAGAFI